MLRERRNPSRLGRERRAAFAESLERLRALGMPDWAVQCYGRAARIAGQLPHDVVCRVAVWTANQMLGANPSGGQSSIAPPPADRGRSDPASAGPRKRGRTH